MALESQQRTIGKYQVLGPLGRGAMGLVYKARDPEIGRVVAVKTLRKLMTSHLHDADAALERFRNEARSAGNLRHQNIITIFEIGRDGDTPFIVMDYVEGRTVEELLDAKKKFPPTEAIKYLRQIAAGLDYAHQKSIIHRDIKPANLLVDAADNLFILDFGIASINDSIAGVEPQPGAPVMGTPSYMAPEQVLNEKLDHRADLFALAIVAFECLTGERPFRGENFTEVISNIVAGKAVALTAVAPHLPLSLESEFSRALAREREARFGSAGEMISAFAQALRIEGAESTAGAELLPVSRQRASAPWTAGAGDTSPATVGWREPRPSGMTQSISRSPAGHTPGTMFRDPIDFTFTLPSAGRKAPMLRRWTVALGAVCVVLGGILTAELFGGAVTPAGPTADEIEDRLADASKKLSPPSGAAVPQSEDAPLEQPNVEDAPSGKPIAELSDKQLLGVIVGRRSAEGTIIEAMRIALGRRTAQLADAVVVPLANDAYLVRVEAAKVLAELGDRRVVPRLVLVLDDHDPLVRSQVAKTLAALGDRRALGYLSARLTTEDSPEVRSALKRAIERLSGLPVPE